MKYKPKHYETLQIFRFAILRFIFETEYFTFIQINV
jgi:hypothetical protein